MQLYLACILSLPGQLCILLLCLAQFWYRKVFVGGPGWELIAGLVLGVFLCVTVLLIQHIVLLGTSGKGKGRQCREEVYLLGFRLGIWKSVSRRKCFLMLIHILHLSLIFTLNIARCWIIQSDMLT